MILPDFCYCLVFSKLPISNWSMIIWPFKPPLLKSASLSSARYSECLRAFWSILGNAELRSVIIITWRKTLPESVDIDLLLGASMTRRKNENQMHKVQFSSWSKIYNSAFFHNITFSTSHRDLHDFHLDFHLDLHHLRNLHHLQTKSKDSGDPTATIIICQSVFHVLTSLFFYCCIGKRRGLWL